MRKGIIALSIMTAGVAIAASFSAVTYAGFVTNTRIEDATVGISRVVYLDTGVADQAPYWNKDGARFFVYVWTHNNSTGEDSDGAFVNDAFMKNTGTGNRYFWAVVPSDCNRIIFGRCSNSAPAPTWSDTYLWNQTADLTLQSDKDMFVIADNQDGDGKYTGNWSNYSV